jgi:hypothetical protein
MALNDEGRGAGDGLMAKVRDEARRVALDELNRRLNNTVVGGRLNWDMLTQWGHRLLDNGVAVPIRPKLDLVGFTVVDDPAGDLTRVTGSSGGGTGGDWVELASHTVPAGGGEGSMDFPSLPQTYRSLVAVGDNIQYVSYSAVDGKPICFLANAWNGNDYVQRIHRFGYDGATINDVVTPTPGNSGAIGHAPGPAGDEPVSSFVCWFPGYTNATKYKTYHGNAEYSFGSTTLGFDVGGFARLALASHVNVDQLTFYANYSAGGAALDLFAPGSRITIYGVSGPSGGGGIVALVGAKAHDTGGIVCPSGSITPVALDAEYWDTGTFHDVVTNNERVTVPSDGYYRVSARVELENYLTPATADPFYGLLQLLLSGSTIAEDMVSTTPAAFNAGHRIVLKIDEVFHCTAGQYFSLTIQQNAGVSVVTNADSWRQARLGVERVG